MHKEVWLVVGVMFLVRTVALRAVNRAGVARKCFSAASALLSGEVVLGSDGIDDQGQSQPKRKQKEHLKLKVRQHVNPLSAAYLTPKALASDWVSSAFEDSSKPMVLDVGCAKGTWILQNGKENNDVNYLGLEIRKPVVEYALARVQRWGLNNVHFLDVNANVDLPLIMGDLKQQGISVDMICFHHPDPHFKKKHKKRRVVTHELVQVSLSKI